MRVPLTACYACFCCCWHTSHRRALPWFLDFAFCLVVAIHGAEAFDNVVLRAGAHVLSGGGSVVLVVEWETSGACLLPVPFFQYQSMLDLRMKMKKHIQWKDMNAYQLKHSEKIWSLTRKTLENHRKRGNPCRSLLQLKLAQPPDTQALLLAAMTAMRRDVTKPWKNWRAVIGVLVLPPLRAVWQVPGSRGAGRVSGP